MIPCLLLALLSSAGGMRVAHGRRAFATAAATAASGLLLGGPAGQQPAHAFIAGTDEEISGLVVLRVAEVCQFQEKLLRQLAACTALQEAKKKGKTSAVVADQFGNAYCEGEAYSVNPVQITFGTGILLRNSNLDGNMRLMIRTDVPRAQRDGAASAAAAIMNTFNELANVQATYGVEFTNADMLAVADIYSQARKQLARFFDYLPRDAKDQFYNYNTAVRQYEEKDLQEEGIERMKL